MYKNQLQELAQRSCFNLPSYTCIREGPDHAPRFKASVNFCGEIFESPNYCNTLRQAEHSAAEVALNILSSRCPSKSLTARVLDETGVYKNLLQETAHRAGLKLPVYSTVRSGPGHVPIFTCTVELAGLSFNGEAAKTKKQAEKNAAIAAWSSFKTMPNLASNCDESKRIRRKENQSQGARKQVRGQREDGPTNYTPRHHHHHQPMKLKDILVNDSLQGGLTNKQCTSFSSLLPLPPPPPPPLRTSSKILPPPSLTTSVENQKDENNWFNGRKSEPMTCGHVGRTTYNARYQLHKIAPAVQMRSVIPVCAAPAPPQSMKEDDASSAFTSKSSLSKTELNSMINKLRLNEENKVNPR